MILYLGKVNYNYLSRYTQLQQITDDGSPIYFETQNQITIPESTDDIYHTVNSSQENRLDILALKYYNNASFWWIIAQANDIIDPFSVKLGTVLRIPKLSVVSRTIGS